MTRRYASSVQYWLYAVLAKRFGKALSLKRSHVSRMYEVNRHDFEARPEWNAPGDHYAFAASLHKFILEHLAGAGFRPGGYRGYLKRVEVHGKPYEVCVTVRYEPTLFDVKNDIVSLSVSMHRAPA